MAGLASGTIGVRSSEASAAPNKTLDPTPDPPGVDVLGPLRRRCHAACCRSALGRRPASVYVLREVDLRPQVRRGSAQTFCLRKADVPSHILRSHRLTLTATPNRIPSMKSRIQLAVLSLLASAHLTAIGGEPEVALETQMIRLPVSSALELIFTQEKGKADGDAILARTLELVASKRAEMLDCRTLSGDATVRLRDVDAKPHPFATEYDLEGAGRRAKLVGLAEEKRDVGTIASASLTPLRNGSVRVALEFERHLGPPAEHPVSYPSGNRLLELEASQPEFRFHLLSSTYTAHPGRAALVAAVSPVEIDATGEVAHIDLLFATVVGKAPEKPTEVDNSDIGLLVVSVSDALGAKVEAQKKSDLELLTQLIGAVKAGKATLEAVTYNHRSLRGQCDDPVRSVLESRLPKSVDFQDGVPFPVPEVFEPTQLGIVTGAYVKNQEATMEGPWRLRLDLERPKAVRKRDATRISYEGANLEISGVVELADGSTTKLVDVSSKTVGKPRRYFTFLQVRTK